MRQGSMRGEGAYGGAPGPRDPGGDDGPGPLRPPRSGPVPGPRNEGHGRRRSAPPAEHGAEHGERPAPAADGDGAAPPRRGHRRAARPRRKRSLGVRILRWTALTLSVLILGTAGAGYLYYRHLNGNLKKDDLNLGKNQLDKSAPNADGQTPLNILLLGSDSRNSAENVKLGGARDEVGNKPRADVQMLLHVSADRSNMSVVSVPRDTHLTIPECRDKDGTVYPQTTGNIINASLEKGGPGCTVATWEQLTGIPIDHFMMIDFAGVVDMADAIGGVPVCVKNNVHDPDSGLRMTAGTKKIQGQQALQWLRTRHGFEDGSDIGRAKAQHMYMNAMARQLQSGTKLSDPGQLMDLAEAATSALTVDRGLGTVKKLYDLGNDIKRVPTKRITMTTMPWVPDPQKPDAWVVPNAEDADKLFSLIRNDIALDGKDKKKPVKKETETPAPTDPADPAAEIPVTVQNGTSSSTQAPVPGRAGAIVQALAQQGFTQALADATPKPQAETTVSYPSDDQHGNAQAVAKALGLPDSAVQLSSSVAQVTLVVGADWREGTAYPEDAGGDKGSADGNDTADDNKVPASADALSGDKKDACMDVNTKGGYTF